MRLKLFLLALMILIAQDIAYADSTVSLVFPNDGFTQSNKSIRFYYNATSNGSIVNCSLLINNNVNLSDNSITQTDYFDESLSDGSYGWGILCNEADGTPAKSSNYKLNVDTTPPTVTPSSPVSLVTASSVEIRITTDENANCSYSTASGSDYSSMSVFSLTGGKTHTATISSLTDNTYRYYIKCRDDFGNVMKSDYLLVFEASLPPTAEIELSDPSPVKAGVIEIKVIPSKNIGEQPTLTYSYDDSTTEKQIALTGSDSLWKGYLVIPDLNEKKIGSFHFSGTDIKGSTGTFITEGRLFIVDTIEPEAPINIRALPEKNGDIKLKWYSQDEDVDYYNIYRSTTSGLTYLDYYSSSNQSQYTDKSTFDKATYYYKVAVVDKAGNIGPLSAESYATSLNSDAVAENKPAQAEEKEVPKVLPPGLVPKADASIKKMDQILIDIREAASKLGGSEAKAIIKEAGIDEDVSKAETKINRLKEELSNLKLSYMTKDELEQQISKIELEAKKIEKSIPKEIILTEKTEFMQTIGEEDITKAVTELSGSYGLDKEKTQEYISRNKKAQKDIKVQTAITIFSIRYLDETKEFKTLIQKKISHEGAEPLKDAVLIETIPKEAAESTNDIQFLSEGYEIMKEDPIVKWGFLELNSDGESIKYIINKETNIEDAKKAKSVLLNLNQADKSPVTGYSILSFGDITQTQKAVILAGLGIIFALTAYYFIFVKKRKELKTHSAKKQASFHSAVNENVDNTDHYLSLAKIDSKENAIKLDKPYRNDIELIQSLIIEANDYLDNQDYNRAAIVYPQISLMYKYLPAELKQDVHSRCAELHSRMSRGF